MKLALIIRTLNEEAHIGRLLSGVQQQTIQPDEIILVDSGSTDATVAIATRFDAVRIVSIQPKDFSFGRALNVGIAASDADIIVLASAHVYPLSTSWLEELVRPLSNQGVVITYGRQVGNERTTLSEHQVFRKWFPEQSDPSQEHPFCNNANAAIARVWWEAHPYDEELTGLEDLALAKEAIRVGYRLAYVATAPVAHVHEETFSRILNRYRREAVAFKAIFPGHEMGVFHSVFLAASNVAADLYHAALTGQVSACLSIVRFRIAQFAGGYLGSRQRGTVPTALTRRFYYPKRLWRQTETVPLPGQSIAYGATGERAPVEEDSGPELPSEDRFV